MFYNAFPNYLREELNIVLEILPKKTFNNMNLILENMSVEVCLENASDMIEHLKDKF